VVAELMKISILHCNFFGSIWHIVLQWLCVVYTSPTIITDHLCQFGHLGGSFMSIWSIYVNSASLLIILCLGNLEWKK